MRHLSFLTLGLLAVTVTVTSSATASPPKARVSLQAIGTHHTGVFEQGAAEIVAYDPGTYRLFVVNAAATSVDVLDIANPTNPVRIATIHGAALGAGANSVAVKDGLLAVAIQAGVKTDAGLVAFYATDSLELLKTFPAGALPDMVTFTPDGKGVLVANEGEPNDDYTVDPEGSITYVDLSAGLEQAVAHQIRFDAWNSRRESLLKNNVRVFGPNASVAQDFEPEYLAVSDDSRYAWATLQENNALAKIDLRKRRIEAILPLDSKSLAKSGNEIDASDRDRIINIAAWPVRALYLPDSIAAFSVRGKTYLLTANEGDARDYDGFAEEARVKDLTLDPVAFPNAAALRADGAIGRLNVTRTLGDTDADGDYDALFAFGGRSFSIWSGDGDIVFDSGRAFEEMLAEVAAPDFGSDHVANGSFDTRSDNKGPEPEGITVGEHAGRMYAFIGLERQGGIVVYDVTNPKAPVFQDYINHRNFLVPTRLVDGSSNPAAGDLGPEGLVFIPAADSPNGKPLLAVGNEVSGTTTLYQLNSTR